MNKEQKKELTAAILKHISVPRKRLSEKQIAKELCYVVEKFMDKNQLVFAI